MDRPATSSICSLAKILWYDRQGANSCSAIVFEQTGQTVRVSTTSPLPRFGRVRLTMGGLQYFASVEAVAIGSQNNEAQLALQEPRRIDERLPSRGAMRLAPIDPLGGEIDVEASNYSRGGLQVASPQPLADELLVHISADNVECYGVVRYCSRSSTGFLIGIELIEPPVLTR